jgi:uncharacterized protein YbaP (TraB family)
MPRTDPHASGSLGDASASPHAAGIAEPVGTRRDARHRRWAAARVLLALLLLVSPLYSAPPRNLIWKATGGGPAVVYFVGSVHVLTKDYYPLNPALEDAFRDASLLVEEADFRDLLSPDSQLTLLTRGMLPQGQSLQKVLSPGTYAAVSKRLANLGMPIGPLQRFKPWLLALTLMSTEWRSAGFDPALGLDKHFYDRATADGKEIRALETVDYQISRFDQLTMDEQDHLLMESLNELDTEQGNITTLADAWRAGDAPAVERVVLKAVKDDPQMYQRLLVERNRNWLPVLESFFDRRGTTFVVVGAAHLVGPDGLLALLKAKGYRLEQL